MTALCIYHGGCTDGVAAAWAVHKAIPKAEFFAGVYQRPPPMDRVANASKVFLVDFSYKQPVLREMCTTGTPITVLDHHKTAQEDLTPLLDGGLINGEFDMERCGALMAWDYFHSPSDRPALLSAIDAHDRWLPTRDAPLIMCLKSFPHAPDDDSVEAFERLMSTWNGFMTNDGLARLQSEAAAIYRYHRQRVDETKKRASYVRIAGYAVPIVNAPYYLASDVAGELAQESESQIGAVFWVNIDGSVTFSLRSRKGGPDVGSIASAFGGGGHPGAAGFKYESLGSFYRTLGTRR